MKLPRIAKHFLLAAAGIASFGAFADDPYIASDASGTLYAVDTGYMLGENSAVLIDFELLELSPNVEGRTKNTQILFEATDGAYGYARTYVNGNGNLAYAFTDGVAGGTDQWVSMGISAAVGTRYTMSIDGIGRSGTLTYGENSITKAFGVRRSTIQATTTLKLFSDNTMAANAYGAMMKLYAFKIYESGELVRDYIPALKGGRPGLYDRVNGGFISNYVPAGVDFNYGGDIETVEDDAYIESDGTAFVNSRYFMNPQSKIEVDYALTGTERGSSDKYIFGASQSPTSGMKGTFYVRKSGDSGALRFACGDNSGKGTNAADSLDTYRRIAILDVPNQKYHWYIKDQADVSGNLTSGATYNNINAYPVALFGCMNSASAFGATSFSSVRIYRAKFWNGDTLVHDYVPCVQGGIPGFRDNVDGAFVFSENGAGLRAGGDITTEIGPGYIVNSGKAVFDTGFYPTPNTHIEVDYMCVTTNEAHTLFGAMKGTLYIRHYINGKGSLAWTFQDSSSNSQTTDLTAYPNRRQTFVLDSKENFAGLVTAGYTNYNATISTTRSNDATKTLKLFYIGEDYPDAKYNSDIRLYGCRVRDNGTLVRNYIPYVKGGVAGLYDSVNDTFTGSANVFAFSAGGEISNDGCPAYIESDGTQVINTAYHMNSKARVEVDFAYTDISGTGTRSAIMGAYSCGHNKTAVFVNKSTNLVMRLDGDTASVGFGRADTLRHTAKIDAVAQTLSYDETVKSNSYSSDTEAEYPIGLFDGVKDAAGTSFNGLKSKAKLFAFRVYETEDKAESLVHEYLPYRAADGTVGLRDTVTGNILVKAVGENAFAYGGKGNGAADVWFYRPQNCTVSKTRSEATLTANASGAVSYKWTKNGAAIVGGENGELDVAWVRNGGTDAYTVTPVYDIYGREVEGSPVACTVEHAPMGLMVFLR